MRKIGRFYYALVCIPISDEGIWEYRIYSDPDRHTSLVWSSRARFKNKVYADFYAIEHITHMQRQDAS